MSDTTPADDAQRTVFVSYSRDDRPAAVPIIEALANRGLSVWWDGLLKGGDVFAQTTETALETADTVVVLWSARSIQSHWVRDEATRGRDRGCMVSVSLDGSEPPLGFRQIQYIDLSDWRGKEAAPQFAELLHAIDHAAKEGGLTLTFGGTPPTRTKHTRRNAMLLGGAGIVLAGGGLAAWQAGLFSGAALENSIAVMAFRNLSGDPAQDYFSDGLAEELRATLSFNRQLEVAAETSSNMFRGTDDTVEKIADALGVAFILEGSVRRSADVLRITARLVDGGTGFEKWSETFERELEDLLAVQSEIASRVVDALVATLASDTVHAERVGGTHNVAAFDAYLRGKALYDLAADEASDRGALAAFEEAVRLDPKYAVAHAALSRALTVIGSAYSSSDDLQGYFERSMTAARKAMELAPGLAEGYSALGFVLMNGKLDMRGARQPYEKSFELGYGNAAILEGFATYASFMGEIDGAREAVARAERLDPLNASVFRTATVVEFIGRDVEATRQAARSALALNPKVNIVHRALGDIALLEGDPKTALAEFEQEPSTLSRLRGLAIAEARISGQEAGQKRLDELVGQYGDNSLYQQAQVYAQWGRKSEALAALEQGLAAGDGGLILAKTDPLLDPIRQDARFASILEQLGFT